MPLFAKMGLAWILGIALARWLQLPWPVILLLAVPGVAALLLYKHSPNIKIAAVLALALTAGAFRLSFFQPVFTPEHIAFYNDAPQPAKITGVVADEPDVRDTYTNLRLRAETIRRGDATQPVDGLLLVRAPRYPAYHYGDRLTVIGRLETPPEFEDFSYKDYLARFGIHAMIRRPHLELADSGQGNPFWAAMYAFKGRAAESINRILVEPHAALLNGILLGIETGIPRALYEDFNLTGTSHIIVISGSNISLVAGLLLLLGTRAVGHRYAPPLAIIGIVLYTLLVGADAAVSRAAVMGLVFVLATWVGRPGLALNSLFASAVVLTLLNPLILWDVGFQLSFMATLGLIVLVPPLEQATFGLLQRRLRTEQLGLAMALLSELLIITLAAQIITGPLIVYHFGRLSLVSLLSNLLILPAQPPIMIVGGLAALAGMLWTPLGQALGWLVWLPLAWSVWIVEQTARLPLASLDLGQFPLWLMLLAYAAIAAGIWWLKQPQLAAENRPHFRLPELGSATTRLWVGGAGLTMLLMWLAVAALPDGRLHVAFLDVGQGDAILLTLPDGRQMLIDGGPSPTELNWRLGQQMPFWDHTIELVLNTHPDADHLAGLVSLPERFTLGQVLVTGAQPDTDLFAAWQAELSEAGLSPLVGQAGARLALGDGLTATLLGPPPTLSPEEKTNNHSLVLHLQYGDISFLFPGDIEAPVEQLLVDAGLPPATVLKSPHHGSKSSSTEPFLQAVNPQMAVISVAADNRFGHPSPEVLERYAVHGVATLRTDERGTIELITDGQRLWLETAR
ncbi:MAG: DNA internalization-related competence protein ComEC/Rec2 [Anaerolineae bacterium]